MEDDILSEYAKTELDTFKVIANSDMVDWSRNAPELKKKDNWGGGESPLQTPKAPFASHFAKMGLKEDSPERHAPSPPQSSRQPSPSRAEFAEEGKISGTLLRQEVIDNEYISVSRPYNRSASKTPPLPKSRSSSPPRRQVKIEMEEHLEYRGHQREYSEEREEPRASKFSSTRNEDYRETTPPTSFPKRTMPQPKKYSASEENDDYEIKAEKEGILHELHTFSRPPHNIKMTREWNIDIHTLDELQYELDRINSELNANGIVDMAKSGIKFGVSGLEMFMKQQGMDSVDGWYANSCKDMSKFNRPLLRLYKKYWRNTNMSPMMELGYLLFGGLVWTVAENKMGFKKGSSSSTSSSSSTPSFSASAGSQSTKSEDRPSQSKMRPPSNASFSMPKWDSKPAQENTSFSSTVQPEVLSNKTSVDMLFPPAPRVEPSAKSSLDPSANLSGVNLTELVTRQNATEKALDKVANDNAVMIQMLKQLSTTKVSSPKTSPREFKLPLGKRSTKRTPKINVSKEDSDGAMSL